MTPPIEFDPNAKQVNTLQLEEENILNEYVQKEADDIFNSLPASLGGSAQPSNRGESPQMSGDPSFPPKSTESLTGRSSKTNVNNVFELDEKGELTEEQLVGELNRLRERFDRNLPLEYSMKLEGNPNNPNNPNPILCLFVCWGHAWVEPVSCVVRGRGCCSLNTGGWTPEGEGSQE